MCCFETSEVGETRKMARGLYKAYPPHLVEPAVPICFHHRFSLQQHGHCPASRESLKIHQNLWRKLTFFAPQLLERWIAGVIVAVPYWLQLVLTRRASHSIGDTIPLCFWEATSGYRPLNSALSAAARLCMCDWMCQEYLYNLQMKFIYSWPMFYLWCLNKLLSFLAVLGSIPINIF
jgi:hypothetical protein